MSKKTNKFFHATLATAVAASGVAVAAPVATEASTTFSDVKNSDYFYNNVMDLQSRGIIKGFEDGTFRPNQFVTRGQAAKILAGVLGLDTNNVKDPGFKDIPKTHQYYGAIAALANAGIISGFEDGTFRQGQPVLRNHVAKMLAGGFGLEATSAHSFTDVRADYAPFISALVANGVTTGKTATTFDGGSNVTRGQLAAFVARAENAKKPSTEAKEATLTIDTVSATGVKTAEGNYTVAADVAALFKSENAAALKSAQVKALVVGNEIVEVINVTLQAASTATTPIVFDGGNAVISNQLVVKSAYTTVKNVTVKGAVVIDKVAMAPVASLGAVATEQATAVNFENVVAPKVDVQRDGITISSNTKLAVVSIAAGAKAVTLNASVGQLVAAANTKITLATTAKIDQLVLPEGVKAQDVIANYNSVKANIVAVIDTKGETVKVSSGGGGGGGGSSSSNNGGTTAPDKTPEGDKEKLPETGEGPGPEPDPNAPELIVNEVTGEKISVAGTYGPETGNQVIEGNLIIEAADVTLRNVTVKGKLILAASVGEGDVNLQGVKVEGETIVNGGGQNSIYFTDSLLATVIVNKNSGAVRIVAQGSTQVYEVQLESPTIVEEVNLDADSTGFEDIIVTEALQTGMSNVQVELRGVFETVNSRVANVRIDLSGETDIRTLILNAAAQVLGAGTIQLAQINASGSTLSQRPQNLVLDINGHVTIGSETVTESYSDENAMSTVTGIRAAQGVINVDMTQFIAGLTVNDFDVVAYVRGEVSQEQATSTGDSGTVTTTADATVVELSNLYYDAAKKRFTFTPLDVQQYNGQEVEVHVTPKHEKLSTDTVISAFTVSTGFGGRITDILGVGIPNLTINFREGAGTTTGDVVGVTVTDDYGYYTVDLPVGVYTGEFSSPGYVTTYLVGVALSDEYQLDQNETAIRAAASQEVKIMLSWGERPYDLDSHLQGPASNDGRFHIAYYHKQHTEGELVYADLDWDDTNSYGPETTTIRKLVDGEYRFFVHNYSGNPDMSTSDAKVSVFLGNASVPTQTFEIPKNGNGELYWDVFDLIISNNGETVAIRPVNVLSHTRQSVEEIIQDGYYYDIHISENATIEQKVAAVQKRVDDLALPEGTNPVVSYDEETDRYIVSYTKNGATYTLAIWASFFVVTVENLLEDAFSSNLYVSLATTQADRLAAVQNVVDQIEFPSNEAVTVSYDATNDQFIASYDKDGVIVSINIYPTFLIEEVTWKISSLFYEEIEVAETDGDAEKLAIVQQLVDELELPEGIEPVVTVSENSWTYMVSFAVNDWTVKLNVHPNFYVPSVYHIIYNAPYNLEISVNATPQDRVAKLQEVVDGLSLPAGTNAVVAVDDYKNYTVTYNDENGYTSTVYINPSFTLQSELFLASSKINITTNQVSVYDVSVIEGIELIAGSTADTTTITFTEGDVTMSETYEPYGFIFSFDQAKATGVDLAEVQTVRITYLTSYGNSQTIDVSIAQ